MVFTTKYRGFYGFPVNFPLNQSNEWPFFQHLSKVAHRITAPKRLDPTDAPSISFPRQSWTPAHGGATVGAIRKSWGSECCLLVSESRDAKLTRTIRIPNHFAKQTEKLGSTNHNYSWTPTWQFGGRYKLRWWEAQSFAAPLSRSATSLSQETDMHITTKPRNHVTNHPGPFDSFTSSPKKGYTQLGMVALLALPHGTFCVPPVVRIQQQQGPNGPMAGHAQVTGRRLVSRWSAILWPWQVPRDTRMYVVANTQQKQNTHTHIYIYIYVYLYVYTVYIYIYVIYIYRYVCISVYIIYI